MKIIDEIHRLDNMIKLKEAAVENIRAVVWGEKLAYKEELDIAEDHIRNAMDMMQKFGKGR